MTRGILRRSPELDSGHGALWSDLCGSLAAGRGRMDPEADSAIGCLLPCALLDVTGKEAPGLRPLDPGARLTALPDNGWFESKSGGRVPLVCPTGLLTPLSRRHSRAHSRPSGIRIGNTLA